MIPIAAPREARVAIREQGIGSIIPPAAIPLESPSWKSAVDRSLYPYKDWYRSFANLGDELLGPGNGVACGAAYLRAICDLVGDACLSPRGLQLVVDLPPSAPMECRDVRSMAFLVLEAVLNAVKHAFPGKQRGLVTIRLSADPKFYHAHCRISDDGIGMKGAGTGDGGGRGVTFMHATAMDLKCNLFIMTSQAGTSISFRVPQFRS